MKINNKQNGNFRSATKRNNILAGTTIIVLKSTNFICIASDRKIVKIDDSLDNADSIRKIKIINNIAYASAGVVKDAFGLFDVDSIVKEAANGGRNLIEIYRFISDKIRTTLPTLVENMQTTNLNTYTKYLQYISKIEIVLIGMYENNLSILGGKFEVSEGMVCLCENIDFSSELGVCVLGCQEEINNYLDNCSSPFKNDIQAGFEFLIKLEADKNPDFVSLPVDILKLDIYGNFTWL